MTSARLRPFGPRRAIRLLAALPAEIRASADGRSGGTRTPFPGEAPPERESLSRELQQAVGDIHGALFGSIGILVESGLAHAFALIGEEQMPISIGNERFVVLGLRRFEKLARPAYMGSGWELSPMGLEILSLIDVPADRAYVDVIRRILSLMGLSLEPR